MVASLRVWSVVAGLGAPLLVCSPALATYSVLLTNTETREVGTAIASCVGDFDLSNIFGWVSATSSAGQPRQTAILAQALYSSDNKQRALQLLGEGTPLAGVLQQLRDPLFDVDYAQRQYEVLSNSGEGLTWTGDETLVYADGVAYQVGDWSFTAAGNILTSERVLGLLVQTLTTASGSIEDRLMTAMESVVEANEGDQRCGALSADSAFLAVIDADGIARLQLSERNTAPESAVRRLRAALNAQVPPAVDSAARDAGQGLATREPAQGLTDPLSASSATESAAADSAQHSAGCRLAVPHAPSRPWDARLAWVALLVTACCRRLRRRVEGVESVELARREPPSHN